MSENTEAEIPSSISEYEWMVRPCEMYKDEYNECVSIKARFHQYFIFGEMKDCSQWQRDFDNCERWEGKKDQKAVKELIESERQRRKERLRAHYGNDTWERRTSPPEGWSKPLPENICKDYETSYLGLRAKEMRGEKVDGLINADRSLCVIM